MFEKFPAFDSPAFWYEVEKKEFSLETIVWLFRASLSSPEESWSTERYRQRLLSIVLLRLRAENLHWARQKVLRHYRYHYTADQTMLMEDLCADLEEEICRAIKDPRKAFWHINFCSSLYYSRKHVCYMFLRREGNSYDVHVKKGHRVPLHLISSLDHHFCSGGGCSPYEIEDENAWNTMSRVELYDLQRYVLSLPDRLRHVVVLIFWAGKTEKDAAHLLGVTDRTVRNRLQRAYKLLHSWLDEKSKPAVVS